MPSFQLQQSRFIAVLSLIQAMISISTGASLAKQMFPLIGSEGTSALRTSFAAIILLSLWRPWRNPPAGRNWHSVIIYGAALGGINLLFYMSIARIPLGIAVALEFTGPLAVALFASKRATDLLWAACAILGIILLLPLTETSAPLDGLGIFYALAAGGCWALYIISGQKVGTFLPGGTATALGMSVAALLVLLVGVATTRTTFLSWQILPLALGLAILSSALPYSLEMVALKRLPAKTFSILLSLEPALASLSGLLFLNEVLSYPQWLGVGLVILASVGSTLSVTDPRIS